MVLSMAFNAVAYLSLNVAENQNSWSIGREILRHVICSFQLVSSCTLQLLSIFNIIPHQKYVAFKVAMLYHILLNQLFLIFSFFFFSFLSFVLLSSLPLSHFIPSSPYLSPSILPPLSLILLFFTPYLHISMTLF